MNVELVGTGLVAMRLTRRALGLIQSLVEGVINRGEHQSNIRTPKEALDKPQKETAEADPPEGGQCDFQQLVHVEAFGRDQAVDDTDEVAHTREQTQRPGDEFRIQHDVLS